MKINDFITKFLNDKTYRKQLLSKFSDSKTNNKLDNHFKNIEWILKSEQWENVLDNVKLLPKEAIENVINNIKKRKRK